MMFTGVMPLDPSGVPVADRPFYDIWVCDDCKQELDDSYVRSRLELVGNPVPEGLAVLAPG
jgi:hypothetical protein